ncbi:MAG: tripartite tricarboxylate transporter permease [Burkholderiales bacterium]|nr:MAG: tripartite tricarboxylate transporter permease [Burkholderiales bacterium]
MEILLASLQTLARADVIAALLVGSVGGVIIGAIPGVGPAIAIAILLPATFAMEPIVGLTLLLGIYGSAMFGGALPAILINTPGTAVNALTTYDGYPMTRRGEAQRALALAYGASFIGGVFSVLCLMLLAPVLAEVAPMFGSREIFMAALLGMVLVVISHRGRNMAAGAMLCLGIFLNTVGLEAVRYTRRYTFDQTWLASGVDLIVVVLGLFAISQAFLLLTGRDDHERVPPLAGGPLGQLLEVLRYPRVLFPSASFGVVMGIIPGVGEFLAQFFGYTLAQKTSRTPEQFGRGSPEGLVASEAANNAVPPAAMVPLLALGIPGEALTAMMLSVFYVHNVVPGPGLFRDQPEFVLSLYLCLLLLNVLALVFLLLATRWLLHIIVIPNRFLGMAILTLSFVGVYSLRNSATDCAMAAGFGLLGLILKRLNLPIVPIVLGMVLGGIVESKFRTSLARVETPLDFIERPIAATIFGIIVAALALHVWSLARARPWRRAR